MGATCLHVRAAVWGSADNRIAVLLVEIGGADDEVLLTALTAQGLKVITELDRLALPVAGAWRVRAGEDARITLTFARRTVLLDAPVELPGVWRWAARRRGAVLLLVGADLDLADPDPGRRRDRLAAIAARGALLGAAVSFESGTAKMSTGLREARRKMTSRGVNAR
ncbi:hypothetical protein [Nocardia sp. NRRL S-836]|uniref:hypothetical protein n=1 Tax=Nocardia sp. NRRL S-836 TaxID=1519492 RepID=UPI0006B05C0A|nr:hypothetical protein [Nocardia sp. NRRL S-836]KOV87901.1 hypothetical protein ADL03_05785 [Nocardia sp. NRRL S-836]